MAVTTRARSIAPVIPAYDLLPVPPTRRTVARMVAVGTALIVSFGALMVLAAVLWAIAGDRRPDERGRQRDRRNGL